MPNELIDQHFAERRAQGLLFGPDEYARWAGIDRLHNEEKLLLVSHLLPLPRSSRILDVGTGAGRWLLHLADEGFTDLTGVDLHSRLLEIARAKAAARNLAIRFEEQDAADLRLPDQSFDVVLALQQLVSLIEAPEGRTSALAHFHRVLAPGGLLVASALSWEARALNRWLSLAIAPLKLIKGDRRAIAPQYLPLLKLGAKPNLRFAFEAQPYTYWFRRREFEQAIVAAGFELVETTTSRMLLERSGDFAFGGMLYVIARKPGLTSGRKEPGHAR